MRHWWKKPRPWHRHPNDPDAEDMPEADCEACGGWFKWDPYDHTDCDGEGVFAVPPSRCDECNEEPS